MYRRLLSFSLLLSVVAACGEEPTLSAQGENLFREEIVGGESVESVRTYPWMASLQHDVHGHYCGATLIAPEWLVTAAHCLDIYPYQESQIVLGILDKHEIDDAEVHRIDNVVVHESEYDNWAYGHDIALLHLATPSRKTPIDLASSEDLVIAGVDATLIGWGTTDGLKDLTLPIASDASCNAQFLDVFIHVYNPDAHICVQPQGVTDLGLSDAGDGPLQIPKGMGLIDDGLANGDSGGPLVIQNGQGEFRLVGVASFRLSSAYLHADMISVFSEVSNYLNWITNAQGHAPMLFPNPRTTMHDEID